jgi:serine/threonine protein kinase
VKRASFELARGLQYLHKLQIAHLDLKSPNVLLTTLPTDFEIDHKNNKNYKEEDVIVKIADFGASKLCDNNEVLHERVVANPLWYDIYILFR